VLEFGAKFQIVEIRILRETEKYQNLLFRQDQQLESGFGREEGGEDFVSNLEDVLEFRTHSMVLGGQKGRIQDDTYGHSRFKKHVVSHLEHKVLKLDPRMPKKARTY
jgi:hypothetical protein